MIEFFQTDFASISDLREKYFTEIKLSQELMLEWIVNESDYYTIYYNSIRVGYFIKAEMNYLIEFYLLEQLLSEKERIFREVLDRYQISLAFCKSFDHVMLTCCQTYCASSSIYGTMFRDYSPEVHVELENDWSVRLATEDDIPQLLNYGSGLYETPEELYFTVSNGMVQLFIMDDNLIGCGFFIRILPNKNYYDLGVWVNPEYRNRGYAGKIISYLKVHCLEYGYIPVCGCTVDNVASRKVLEKNGFISKYCMLLYKF